jgi:acetyl-CoA C-acetyltransferase
MSGRVAVVGAGMTTFVRRAQETGKELAWQAAKAALESCELTLTDVDAVALGTAPDAFDGVHRKGDYLADGAGAWGKPYVRTYVGGGTGVFAPIQGWYTIASGMADVVLVVAEEKMSSCQPHPQGAFLTIFDNIIERPLGPNLLWIFALEMNRYMTIHGLDKRDIAAVAVKNKRNAAGHPAALLGQADITVEDVLASEVLAWPVQRLDVSPISDGAVAIVMASEEAAKRISGNPVWVDGVGWNLDTTYWTNRDLVFPEYVQNAARMAYDMAGITEPRKQIHIAEPYDPFDYKELHHLEGLMLFDKGKAPEAARDGVLNRDGDLPSSPSGGLLGVGNPIAAAGLMKIAELFWQLRGEAGARQVPGTPERGVAQAWGDLMQVGTVVVMGRNGAGSGAGAGGSAATTSAGTAPTSTLGPTALSDTAFHRATGAVDDRLDVEYEWDPGEAIGTFLGGLREGRISATHCSLCGRTLVPPRAFCEQCFRPTDGWVDVETTGVVETFSICHVTWDMQPLEPPEIPAVIRIDGSSNGGFLHKLAEVPPDDVRIGMEVEAVWRPEQERTGSILDISHFRPKETG